MKKSTIIFSIIITILTIALIIMTIMYFNMRKIAKKNFDNVLLNAEYTFEANKRIQELEEELEKYKNPNTTEN